MGNTLDSPVKDKDTATGTLNDDSDQLHFGVSSMQGWRLSMEDAYAYQRSLTTIQDGSSAACNPLRNHSLFTVFDGHGGKFAARYAADHFCDTFAAQLDFIEYRKRVKKMEDKRIKTKNKQNSNSKKDKHQQPRVKYSEKETKELCQLLQSALQSTYVDLDRSIFQAMTDKGFFAENAHEPLEINSNQMNNGLDEWGLFDDQQDDDAEMIKGNANAPSANNDDKDAGTTAVVILITPHFLLCSNVGDSRAIICQGSDNQKDEIDKTKIEAVPLSFDHKPDHPKERKRIEQYGGTVNFGRVMGELALSRALGDFKFKDVENVVAAPSHNHELKVKKGNQQMVSSVPDVTIRNRDNVKDKFIVLACDGIWDVLTNKECADTITELFDEGESNDGLICEEIIDMCLKKGSRDNMTIIIIRFPGQEIAIGGGIAKRRRSRQQEAKGAVALARRSKRYY